MSAVLHASTAHSVPPKFNATALRTELARGRAALLEVCANHTQPAAFLRHIRAHCKLVDRTLQQLWQGLGLKNQAALVATGGYGRGELYPYSDVDVLLLLPAEIDAGTRAKLESLVALLWDVGLEVGHSIRTLDECFAESAHDITIQTTLTEARYVVGDRKLTQALIAGMKQRLDPQAFFTAKKLELEQRHAKHQDTPYALEPNCKEAPGGLRDLQVILWLAQASGIGHTWKELALRRIITPKEAAELNRRESFLRMVRVRLHLIAGRRDDRLLFDYQGELAQRFGYVASKGKRASEQLMQRYYINCRWIVQLNTIMLQNIATQLFPGAALESKPLNDRFHVERNLLAASDVELFAETPSALLECFRLLQKHPELTGMTAATLRALWRERDRIDAKFRREPANQAVFLRILQAERGIVHELRRMNQWGILGRYIPAFKRIIGQMQHDLFHVYTVDQHILTVVRNVRRFTMIEHAHEYPLCSRLISNFERPWLLYVAALFHDIAKGRGGDHSVLGKSDARRFCREHGIGREDTQLVVFLVEHHLTMSAVAQKQDLSDPDTIERFTAKVKSERRLSALYLLTVADIRGTSPKVWNAWKGKLLEDLFRAARRRLRGGVVDFDSDLQLKQTQALENLKLYGIVDGAHLAFWNKLDQAYFMRHEAKEIAWQTRTLHYRVDAEQPVVRARYASIGEGLQVMVYVRDQADLFARICGFFERRGLSVLEAKIHTTKHGYALDTFVVLAHETARHEHGLPEDVERQLATTLADQGPLPAPATGRISRQARYFTFAPTIHIRSDERMQRYILSVTAGDRPGLLFRIARVLAQHQVNLHTAKITTLGERAEDVFLIDGPGLSQASKVVEIETDLLTAIAV